MKNFLLISVFFLSVFFQSCSTMYIPLSQNAPLFEQKNEGQVELGASSNSVYLQGAYAFSDKYALIAHGNMSFRNFSGRYDIFNTIALSAPHKPYEPLWPPFDWGYFIKSSAFSHRYVELGGGRYNIGSSTWKKELFAGGGCGYAFEHADNQTSKNGKFENKYWLGFVQGNIGRKWKITELGWSLRMAASGFNFTTPSEISDFYPPYPYLNTNLYFHNIHVEPLFFLRTGKAPVQGFIRVGSSLILPLKSFTEIYLPHGIEREKVRYTIFHLSAGICIRF